VVQQVKTNVDRCVQAVVVLLLSAACSSSAIATEVTVIEYFVPSLDKYFITSRPAEIGLLDSLPRDFARTGMTFTAYVPNSKPVGAIPICRFYLPSPAGPNSHTYLAPDDCSLVRKLGSNVFVDEGVDFASFIPDVAGMCPIEAPLKVNRHYNRRDLTNDGGHRFSTSVSTLADMGARGWLDEGAVFCTPSSTTAVGNLSALPAVGPSVVISPSIQGIAGSPQLSMRYVFLPSVKQYAGMQVIAASEGRVVLVGKHELRNGDVLVVDSVAHKVTRIDVGIGETTVSTTRPELWDVFAEFDISGSAVLSGTDLSSTVGQSGQKAGATVQLEKTLDLGDGSSVVFSAGVSDLVLEESTLSYSALDKRRGKAKYVISGVVAADFKVTLASKNALQFVSKTYPPAGNDIEFFGFKKIPGCFTVAPPLGTLALAIEVPICIEAEVRSNLQGTFNYKQQLKRFRVTVEFVNGELVTSHTEIPLSTGGATLPVEATTELVANVGVYVAPRVVLTSFGGSVRLFATRIRVGADASVAVQINPKVCQKGKLVGVLSAAYAAPVINVLRATNSSNSYSTIFSAETSPVWEIDTCTTITPPPEPPVPPPPTPPGGLDEVTAVIKTTASTYPYCVPQMLRVLALALSKTEGITEVKIYPRTTTCESLGFTVCSGTDEFRTCYVAP
jgi:hypothetical protein